MANLIDYVEDSFSKFKLDDGSVIFISYEGSTFRIAQFGFFGTFPKKQLGRVGGYAQKTLTETLMECRNLEELEKSLSSMRPA